MKVISKQEYLNNSGYSSHHFLEWFKEISIFLEQNGFPYQIRRTHLAVAPNLKFYVHHKGKSNKELTATNFGGVELATWNINDHSPNDVIQFIRTQLTKS